jgi:hypothetical protein
MKTKVIQLLTGVLLLAPALRAQDNEKIVTPYVAFGYNLAQGHGHDLTQTTWGGIGAFSAEAGVQFQHPDVPLLIRPNLGYAKVLGDPMEGRKVYDLFGIYFGFDAVYRPFALPVSISTGPSFHAWSVEEVSSSDDPRQGDRSTKFGWRFGVGYDITRDLRVDLTYTIAPWRGTNTLPFVEGWNPSVPAYFTVKASYKF